ncbi:MULTISPECIES: division/cell wall cluster transcriptional repressor MraZ [unclassified Pseudoclavibacter]|uniref:division/cell wall cluster transcriptional repressor MraZ n=1 Tax=unclassified Pseudoclavibacter TaxID=2615177 RepID=UPI00130147C4|nr:MULTISPECIES: division/cell wall cluster transcriptional repressor MraZ [unclassified Pseudoclavibacter]KAB1658187.1 division/cell wall cluster transcriptional repressor MraZ [Pseudoclavibacter sp. CFCC 11306]KAB1661903.1 division/cell wall cluster transcriptional repressor MraZ [Pseudoclavibacter sp. CFCC 13796]
MFLGTHSPRLDDKGRLVLPAKFRDELADGVVLTRGQEHCVYVFSAGEFENIHQSIRQAPMTSKQARDFLRLFLSGASDQVPDKQGRISVPADLRRYAGLTRDLTVIGTGNRAEIWDSSAWQQYLNANEEPFSETAEEVIPGVF